jgi:hypothetical protein
MNPTKQSGAKQTKKSKLSQTNSSQALVTSKTVNAKDMLRFSPKATSTAEKPSRLFVGGNLKGPSPEEHPGLDMGALLGLKQLVPESLKMKLRFVYQNTLTTDGSVQVLLLGGNMLYAPTSLASHQPYPFDQIMGLYNSFCCLGSEIKFQVRRLAAFVDKDTYIGLAPRPATYTATSIEQIYELPASDYGSFNTGLYPAMVFLESRMRTGDLYSRSNAEILAEANFSGTAAADPTSVWYWVINYQGNNASSVAWYSFLASITYDVVFRLPKTNSPS